MKVKYEFANETVEIEVDEKWADALCELDREEFNDNHRETRRHCSLDALNLDDAYLPSEVDMEEDVLAKLESEALRRAIAQLSPRQQYLVLQYFFFDRSYADLAREEGVDESAVRRAVGRALKKMKYFLK